MGKMNQFKQDTIKHNLRPMYLAESLVVFGIPTILIFISFHILMPWLMNIGLSDFDSMIISHTLPLALLFVAALYAYKREAGSKGWGRFAERYRFNYFGWRSLLAGILTFLVLMFAYGIFDGISKQLIQANLIPVPDYLPALINPRGLEPSLIVAMTSNTSIPTIISAYSVMLFFNIVGEELWWRGYVLPRQELAFGKWTWLLHGLLWTFFHSFKWWDLLALLPVCLIISIVAQRSRNIWIGLIAHCLFNGLGLIVLIWLLMNHH
jgi:membrane protease YdiL (CAAX protease family)